MHIPLLLPSTQYIVSQEVRRLTDLYYAGNQRVALSQPKILCSNVGIRYQASLSSISSLESLDMAFYAIRDAVNDRGENFDQIDERLLSQMTETVSASFDIAKSTEVIGGISQDELKFFLSWLLQNRQDPLVKLFHDIDTAFEFDNKSKVAERILIAFNNFFSDVKTPVVRLEDSFGCPYFKPLNPDNSVTDGKLRYTLSPNDSRILRIPERSEALLSDLREYLPTADVDLSETFVEELKPIPLSVDDALSSIQGCLDSDKLFEATVRIFNLQSQKHIDLTDPQRSTLGELAAKADSDRNPVEVYNESVQINYTKPIPIGDKQLWIARGDDLLSVLGENSQYLKDRFYLVHVPHLSMLNRSLLLYKNGRQKVGAFLSVNYIGRNNLGIDKNAIINIQNDLVFIYVGERPLINLPTSKLIAGHKSLVGGFSNKSSKSVEGKLSVQSSLLKECRKAHARVKSKLQEINSIPSEQFRDFVLDLFTSSPAVLADLRVDFRSEEELLQSDERSSPFLFALKKYMHSLSSKLTTRGNPKYVKLIKKDDFVNLLNQHQTISPKEKNVIKDLLLHNLTSLESFHKQEVEFAFLYEGEYLRQTIDYGSEIITRILDKKDKLKTLLGDASSQFDKVSFFVNHLQYCGEITSEEDEFSERKKLLLPSQDAHDILLGLEAEPLTESEQLEAEENLNKKLDELDDRAYELVRRYHCINKLNQTVSKLSRALSS